VKVIFSGSRNLKITKVDLATAILRSGFELTEVVTGGSGLIDLMAMEYAKYAGLPLTVFYPGWGKLGKFAGPERNKRMALYGDALIYFWDGKSKGTRSMIEEAQDVGLKIFGEKMGDGVEK